ncbi:MAG: hypothetical protein DWQ34_27120 [Planctomycetota bacterium]|nr:MAG: hypothetical protein DWQ29_10810 [Planctomycetota bacterium]REJ86512.1 MAG: hypothetical protein DWQ34_27120 [Planctomycetota bacterium]REK20386.1 MAG: hypothetical protein DWQ41_25720 [Planctomycetota bacterium]REK26883.1 MAG: hypothetical protein DWQ45_27020 [Planctomycetota bacterium]
MNGHLSRLLPAFAVLIGLAGASSQAADPEFTWIDDAEAGVCDLMLGDQPVLRYVYGVDESSDEAAFDTAKVFHHVYGPGSDTLITKGPGGKYPHHRGLYVGWNKTTFDGKTQDFWHCRNGEVQRHVEFVEREANADGASMTALIHWIDKEGEPVIEEQRTVAASRFETDAGPGYGWQIDWSTEIHSLRGEIILDGDRQHAGFQFRAAQYVAETDNARYIRPEGFPQQPEAYQVDDRTAPDEHVDLGWLAMTFEVGDERFTAEYFEDPSMPSPSRYSERPYGRFGAFFTTTVTEDEPLEMRYRVNVTAGDPPTQEAIQARYDAYVDAEE